MAMSESATGAERTTRRRATGVRLAGCALAIGVLAGCGSAGAGGQSAAASTAGSSPASSAARSSSGSSGTGQASMPAGATTIMIESFAYTTPPTVAPGSTVQVMNMDQESHTVTADSGSAFDVTSPAGQTVTFTAPTTPGTYAFHCTYHGNMHGVLVVR
jgi:plastocyanin